ncbi:PLP-dependent aminotransferase family protein [Paenibacillus sp. L3-i20]|uniref:MocR-like pyridoxine biosynthesis transcription factor PdxR n=1 Tax=Paenibacillus sp. L3-i20 TaxID=2905833 RepID=UPI001EDE241A|nr:PLP-dependent aminotransferase family protein [Paenibacillus sp. L3-i20]GKU78322.1 transcriptional regulator [Paenibacillus sp. L3-i20]
MLSITPLLIKSGDAPLYVQLYKYIRDQIERGKLESGGNLPSIRQLASHLGLSKNTVESAYAQLLAEGYVESRERGGFTILPLEEPLRVEASFSKNNVNNLLLDTKESSKIPQYDFRYGDIAFDRFPNEQWKSCMVEALSAPPTQVLGYGDPFGFSGLRQEIAQYAFQTRGVVCHSDQIFISAGTQHAISMVVQLLGLNNKAIAMEEPGYFGVKTVLDNIGCKVHPIDVEQDGISIEKLQSSTVNIVYVTPSHQFPLGMVMPIQKRQRLLQWAADRNGLIIEDDYDSELRYNSQPIPSLKALDTNGNVIYLGTLSKSFLPAARLSYVIMPTSQLEIVREKLSHYSQSVSPIIQHALWLFMKHGYFTRHVRRMKRVYGARHKALTEAIKLVMGNQVDIIGDHSGMHLLLDVKNKRSKDLLRLAEEVDCRVYSPSKHWNHSSLCPDSYVMLGFGGLTELQLQEGINRLNKAWFH